MRRIIAGSVAIASLLATAGAFAADLPARTYTKAPIIVDPGYNWTGFYAGINGGYSWGRANTSITGISPFAPFLPVPALAPFRSDVNGGLADGQIGYNWQVDRKWVLGLEGDVQWSGERASSSVTLVGPNYGSNAIGLPGGNDFNSRITQTADLVHDLRWFATFRGRAGFLADPQTLLTRPVVWRLASSNTARKPRQRSRSSGRVSAERRRLGRSLLPGRRHRAAIPASAEFRATGLGTAGRGETLTGADQRSRSWCDDC
jgi:opacity protein-like surface antigen